MFGCDSHSNKRARHDDVDVDDNSKQEKTVDLVIRSADRETLSVDPGLCRIILTSRPINGVKSARLVGFSVPNSIFNIDGSQNSNGYANNSILINVGTLLTPAGVPVTVTLTPGQYTQATFITALTTAFQAASDAAGASGTHTFAQNSTTKKITLSGVGGTFTQYVSFVINADTQIAAALGFYGTRAGATTSVLATSYVFPNYPLLSYPEWLFLSLNRTWPASEIRSTSFSLDNCAQFAIPITESAGYLVFTDTDVYTNSVLNFAQLATFHTLVPHFRKSDGTTVSFNGADWTLVLRLTLA